MPWGVDLQVRMLNQPPLSMPRAVAMVVKAQVRLRTASCIHVLERTFYSVS